MGRVGGTDPYAFDPGATTSPSPVRAATPPVETSALAGSEEESSVGVTFVGNNIAEGPVGAPAEIVESREPIVVGRRADGGTTAERPGMTEDCVREANEGGTNKVVFGTGNEFVPIGSVIDDVDTLMFKGNGLAVIVPVCPLTMALARDRGQV